MKRFLISFLLLLLCLLTLSPSTEGALVSFATDLFQAAAKNKTVRVVFDLEEEEAVAVFGSYGEKQVL